MLGKAVKMDWKVWGHALEMDRRVGASLMRGSECVGVCGGGKFNERTGMCGCVWRGQAFKTDKQKKKRSYLYVYVLVNWTLFCIHARITVAFSIFFAKEGRGKNKALHWCSRSHDTKMLYKRMFWKYVKVQFIIFFYN